MRVDMRFMSIVRHMPSGLPGQFHFWNNLALAIKYLAGEDTVQRWGVKNNGLYYLSRGAIAPGRTF